jgi:hypothetical protein
MAFPRSLKSRWLLAVVLAVLFLFGWLDRGRIATIPEWLTSLGLLHWLDQLNPLDKWLVVIATACAAFATFCAVGVALFPDQLRDMFSPVRLNVQVVKGVSIPWVEDGFRMEAHHFRLAITCPGNTAARRVEVLVAEVWQNEQELDWAPAALNWTDAATSYRKVLAGGTTRLCDFLMMPEPGPIALMWAGKTGPPVRFESVDFDFQSKSPVVIMSWRHPNGRPNMLPPASYTVSLELSALNVKPQRRFFRIEFDGKWSSAPGDGMRIDEVDGPPPNDTRR